MTADLPAAIRALYRKGWTTGAGTPCVLVRDVERVLGEFETTARQIADLKAKLTDPNEPDWFEEACRQKARVDALKALADEFDAWEPEEPLGPEYDDGYCTALDYAVRRIRELAES